MERSRWLVKWCCVASAVLMCLCALFVGHGERKRQDVKQDTIRVTIYDTLKIVHPIAKDSTVVRYANVRVQVVDTIRVEREADSADVVLPIESKVYEDSLYTAYVSGFMPSLDSISLRLPRDVITIRYRDKPKKWSLGVQVGYGTRLNDRFVLEPYVGIGLQYNIISF